MSDRQTFGAAFIIFVAIGVLSAVLGPALPDLADRAGSDLAALGALFTTTFAGTMLAQVLSGPLNDRLGARPVLLVGLGLGALGTLGIALSRDLRVTLGMGVIFGIGFGALDLSTNLLIAQTFAARSVSALNLLHVFFGVGSVIGPAAAGVALRLWDTALPALWLGIAVLGLAAPFALRLAPGPHRPARPASADDPPTQFSYRAPLLWALGVLLMVYVGLEAGMGAWTTAYTHRSTALSKEAGALLTSGFWLALTAGRVAGIGLGRRYTPYAVLWVCLVGMLAGGLLLALGTGRALPTVLAVIVMGFWAGPPYPTIVAITTATFPSGPGRAASTVVALGSVGAATLPWLQGIVLDRVSTAATALFVAALTLAMVALYVPIRQHAARQAA